MSRRTTMLLLSVAALALAGAAGFHAWRSGVKARQLTLRENAVQKALAEGNGRAALSLLEDLYRQAAGQAAPERTARWQQWETEAAVEVRDLRRLLGLFERNQTLIRNHEDAALLVARTLTAAGKAEDAARVRALWRGREAQPVSWLLYDADSLLRAGKTDDAEALLQSRQTTAPEDSPRLLRLAMIHLRQPELAYKYLQAAYAADPHNPDVRTARGQVLESVGQIPLARVEYTAALLASPKSPLTREMLGDFYLRQHEYGLAVQTFAEGEGLESADFLGLKAQFWATVTSPRRVAAPAGGAAPGALSPLTQTMSAVPAGRFWDEAAFSKLRGARVYTAARPEVFWLRVLQDLQEGKETRAAEALAANKFRATSSTPELEAALAAVLRCRQTGAPPPLDAVGAARGERHPFIAGLAAWSTGKAPAGLEEFVAGPHALSAVFLAEGWLEAALRLAPQEVQGAPEWYRYGLVQATRLNRTPEAALALAQAGPASPLLEMVTGEILLSLSRPAEAETKLRPLAVADSDVGYRAAWLLATRAEEAKDFTAVRALVAGQPRLAGEVAGRELLARCMAQEGQTEAATAGYREIVQASAEAKTFLARQAVAARDWKQARELTEQLIALFPDEMRLRQDLLALQQKEALQ